jgi:hypothetical protein
MAGDQATRINLWKTIMPQSQKSGEVTIDLSLFYQEFSVF